MENNKLNAVVQIIAKAVFSPLIYMVEHNGRVDFVYISNEDVREDILYDMQCSAKGMLNCEVDILDIRYFSEFDKINLIQKSKIVYCENPMLPKMIEIKAVENLKSMMEEKNGLIDRKYEYGSYYLQ